MNARAMERLNLALPNNALTINVIQAQALQKEFYQGRTVVLLQPTTQIAVKMLLPPATGSGCSFDVIVGTALTGSGSGSYVITRGNSTDIIQGSISVSVPATPANTIFVSTTTSKTVTFNNTTTGGLQVGDFLTFWDIASGVWAVNGQTTGSGTVATPFS